LRLEKHLAEAGVASRRKSKEMIREGQVAVNGQTIFEPGYAITEDDQITVNQQALTKENKVYILLNKPKGFVTTCSDEHAEKTVMDLVKINQRIFPVGRLDKDTEGLLLLTNDGTLTWYLTHPSQEFEKTYEALIKGIPEESTINELKKGVVIEEDEKTYRTAPAKVHLLNTDRRTALLQITIHEGKKRQVRKMCRAVGHSVLELKRTREGNLTLEGLKKGQWRFLTPIEIKTLKEHIHD